MKNALAIVLILGLAVSAAFAVQAQKPQKVDFGLVAGIWNLEITAGDQFYYLVLELKMDQGKLAGAMSEQNGLFANLVLANVEFDGQTLKFDMKVPTPPDGVERLVKSEAKLMEGKLQGMMTAPDLGVTVPFAGAKKQK